MNFGYSSIHPVTTELWGEREGEKTHWEGEEKTSVFCILLPWLAQAYAWNRCSVNTGGMYVQMNEKREAAGRHPGRQRQKWESWQAFPDDAPTTVLYHGASPGRRPWPAPILSFLVHMLCATPVTPPPRHPDRSLGVDRGSPLWVQSTWISQLWAENSFIPMLVSGSSSRDVQIESHPSFWGSLLVLRLSRWGARWQIP